jgi:hypothetical protein
MALPAEEVSGFSCFVFLSSHLTPETLRSGPLARIIYSQTPVGFLIGSNRLDRVRETETRRRGKKKSAALFISLIREAPVVFTHHNSLC